MRPFACLVVLLLAFVGAPPAQAQSGFHRGFVLTARASESYLTPSSDAALRRMASGGSNRAAIFTQWFLANSTSSRLAPDAQRTPSDLSILHAMKMAQDAGMEVTVKPQIGIRSSGWIGAARPANLDAFWAGYRAMLLHYADLAQRAGASTLVIGTEMATLSGDQRRWRALIAELRTRFDGALTYAANYDEFARVPFWDALDYIGIDAYFPLADPNGTTPASSELVDAWSSRGHLGAIAAVSARVGKKVIFTELGYRATRSTAVHPNAWDVVDATDTQAQANAYAAFYDAVAGQPWMAGVYWWEVNPDKWWVQDFNPMGKPAEQVIASSNLSMILRSIPLLRFGSPVLLR